MLVDVWSLTLPSFHIDLFLERDSFRAIALAMHHAISADLSWLHILTNASRLLLP